MTTVPGQQRHHSEPGKGLNRGECKRIVCSFDIETFDEIRDRAVAEGTSFAEQVRILTEWGLEADDGDGKSGARS